MKRRKFLQLASLVGAGTFIPVSLHSCAFRGVAQSNNPKRLIVILLRGGMDGLNVVVPYTDAAYYEARPTIAVSSPGEKNGVLDFYY